LEGKNLLQLLLTIIGPCGIGKSTLINVIMDFFICNEQKDSLAITVTSEVAASLIGGTTLHWLAGSHGERFQQGTGHQTQALKEDQKQGQQMLAGDR
jgi:ABC-type transporter Mla maintaining outer membrane lipid asymmetry ATPase subunit MlaF